MKTKYLENIFQTEELFWLYAKLLHTHGWLFSGSSNANDSNPIIDTNQLYGNLGILDIDHNSSWHYYFQGLIYRINKKLSDEKNTRINKNIKRIYINATNPMSKHILHVDSTNPDLMSVLMMLSPQWQDSWLGSFFVDGEEFKMKPGNIIIFDSKQYHMGSNPSDNCPYIRLTCNIILEK